MRHLWILSIILSLALVAVPAQAGWQEGVNAFKQKNYQQAYQEFQTVVQQNPEGFRGHYMLGLTAERLERTDEALTHLRKAYDLNPNDRSTILALGRAYRNAKRWENAARLLASVDVSDLPAAQQGAFYQIRGEARLRSGSEDEALGDFRKLAEVRGDDAQVQYLYGTTALAADRLDEGIRALERASQLAAGEATYHKALANALIKKGRTTSNKAEKQAAYRQAAVAAEKLVAADPSYDSLLLLASAQLGAGEYAAAAESGRKAVAKNRGDWLAHYYLGQALTSQNSFAEAEDELGQALQLARQQKDKQTVYNQLGFVYEKQKKFAEAIEAYGKAGQQAAVARVQKNKETAEYNAQVEAENQRIEEMAAEAERLEKELEELEGGGGGR